MPDISIGRFRGGFCVYWWENGKRRRYQLDARTRAEAEPEAIDVYRRETLSQRQANDRIKDIWEAYIEDLGERPTAKTMGYTGKAILPHFGEYRPDQITTALCRSYTRDRTDAGKTLGTIHTELGHLRSALKWAEKERIIKRAPSIERPAKPTPKERYLEKQEVAALIGAASAPHIALAIHLLYATAGRVGAILELTWDRVDFEHGIINLRVPTNHTRKGRAIVPMNNSLRAALQTARDSALSDYVVEYAGGQVKSIRRGFENAIARTTLENVTLHTIRHSAAVHMVASGIPIEKVGQFLGHSNVAITYQTYARYAPDHLSDAADVLDFSPIRKAR